MDNNFTGLTLSGCSTQMENNAVHLHFSSFLTQCQLCDNSVESCYVTSIFRFSQLSQSIQAICILILSQQIYPVVWQLILAWEAVNLQKKCLQMKKEDEILLYALLWIPKDIVIETEMKIYDLPHCLSFLLGSILPKTGALCCHRSVRMAPIKSSTRCLQTLVQAL